MQVANRTSRRYVTPSMKTQTGNIRPTSKKRSNIPSVSQSSPKKVLDTSTSKSKEPPTLKKLVDRFRYDEPQPRPERDSTNSDFWWLHDELKNNYCSNTNENDERKSNIPEFIEIFPSTDIDQDLNKRASLLLNQTFSAHSSDVDRVSSTGVGSTPSSTLTKTTASTFQPIVHEQPARPIFTRITDSKFNFINDGGEDDILYQWRLRRRLEQAQNGEPITFPSKITNRTHISPTRSFLPTTPIEIPTVLPARPRSPPVIKQSPSKHETQQSSTTNIETEHIKQTVTNPVPVRQYSEASTQTLQDACIQTSLTVDNHLFSSSFVPSEVDLHPTRDNDHHSSMWHRPPPRSKCEITRTSSSPSPIKRHHHHHHSFRPVVTEHPTTNNISHHQRSIINPSNTVQSSQESTLTQVTSIMINDNNNTNNHCQIKNNTHITLIDQYHEQQQNNDDDHINYSNDEILNILVQKRDELLIAFREIEQPDAWVRVRNKGGYVARFYVDYHIPNTPRKNFVSGLYMPVKLFEQTLSSGNYPVGQTRVLGAPRSALTARVRVERFIFYPFFGWYWKEIFRQEVHPQGKNCYDIWGTTVQPYWTSVNC
ncbi:unnamed protein product [Rotaria sp. Silwood1]|nr:unnamed protein product [Rotaria sp. Silwood1]CAF0785609.1 unnamed protein product [Rotaria sp. Silwood1]